MIAGIEVLAARFLAPLLLDLSRAATGVVKSGLKKWHEGNFEKKLANKLLVADRVKTLWSPDEETSLLQIYFPSAVSYKKVRRKTINSLIDLPVGNIVIEGIVGHGKSIFLRYLCLQELTGNGCNTLPLFLELRTLSKTSGLQEKISEALDKLDIDRSPEIFDYLAKSGKMTLFFDGFDELEESLVSETISHLEFLMEKYPGLRIVITSRPSNEIQKSRHVKVVKLCGLRREDYSGFLQKLGLDVEKIHDILTAIDASPDEVATLLTTPLMLTLVVLIYESEREIPSQLPEFFEKLFSTMFSRHDRLKAGFNRKHHSGLSESRLQKLFEAFCFLALRNKHGRTLVSGQFTKNFEKAREVTKELDCSELNFRNDIIRVSCLMLEEGFDSINFLHKSIPEFFAASFIRRTSEDTAKKFYEKAVLDYQLWSSTLGFLQKIDSYRYEKYFNICRLEGLLSALNTKINHNASFDDWKKFINQYFSNFSLGYASVFTQDERDDMTICSWGPYNNKFPWGSDIQQRLITVMSRGLSKDMPDPITVTEARRDPEKYREVFGDENCEFELLLSRIFKESVLVELPNALQIFEREIWNEIDQSKRIISDEDDKAKILEDDIF